MTVTLCRIAPRDKKVDTWRKDLRTVHGVTTEILYHLHGRMSYSGISQQGSPQLVNYK